MALFDPILGVRPRPDLAAQVAELPYDVMDRDEAAAMAVGRPNSLLHVSRPEIDLPGQEFDDPEVYEAAGRAYRALRAAGTLTVDASPGYYAYRITRGQHTQRGLVGGAGVAAYDSGRIRRHELTRPAKQSDRAAHIQATNAQTGPAFLIHRRDFTISAVVEEVMADPAETTVTEAGGTRHEIWPIHDGQLVARLQAAFEAMDRMYIADGHHRSAAAAAVSAARPDDPAASQFLAVAFPDDEVAILPYNRVVHSLGGREPAAVVAAISEVLEMAPAPAAVVPYRTGDFGIYLDGQWWLATAPADLADPDDPVARLDVSVLQDHVLSPILGITDPRTDPGISFVGGVRGVGELEMLIDSGKAEIAFSLRATTVADLLAVADAGEMMPPKSTWFEPKLLDGLVIHELG